jgi:UDP-N-acetylglucosamine 2-epimerase (non-hydrolysing)
MRPDQPLAGLTARLLEALDSALASESPDIVLAQGDTTTVFATALACFYRRIPFGHVEAGLRTWNADSPFPEEINRTLAGRLARWHFAPTASARDNLLREGTPPERITVTGNTVIDALLDVARRDDPLDVPLDPSRRLILVTAHRRENFGQPLEDICRALRTITARNQDVEVLYPVHPNPNVRGPVQRLLAEHSNVQLLDPLDYVPFVDLMRRCHLILTDSGGVQEEAPSLGKPVLVMREKTERPEAVDAGTSRLVGTDPKRIIDECTLLLDDAAEYQRRSLIHNPYGDGRASRRIAEALGQYFQIAV